MTIAWIRTKDGVSLVIDSKVYTVDSSHENFANLMTAIREERWDDVATLACLSVAIKEFIGEDSGIVLRDGVCFYNNKPVHNVVVDRIFTLMNDGFSIKPLVAFLSNLLQNPSYHSREQLYSFLEHKGLPITPDGCFLAYKGVNNDYTDKWTGTILNIPGSTPPPMNRDEVNDDPSVGCSCGYHAGSLEYARNYGPRVVIVKINPKDVVSVPLDNQCQKLRTCAYTVIADWVDTNQYLPDSVYNDEDEDDEYENGDNYWNS